MARKVTVRVEGLREVDTALRELKTSTARSVTRKALHEGGEVIARHARSIAPVDEGHLRESISVSGTLSKSQRRSEKKSDQEVYVGPDSRPQAITQEFGTSFHPPQPFMRPAWDAEKQNALSVITDWLIVGVQKAAARAARLAAKGKG